MAVTGIRARGAVPGPMERRPTFHPRHVAALRRLRWAARRQVGLLLGLAKNGILMTGDVLKGPGKCLTPKHTSVHSALSNVAHTSVHSVLSDVMWHTPQSIASSVMWPSPSGSSYHYKMKMVPLQSCRTSSGDDLVVLATCL